MPGTVMGEAMKKAEDARQKQAANIILHVPAIRKIRAIAAEQEMIDKAVKEAQQYIAAIPDHMTGLVARIRGIQAASVEERAIRSSEFKSLEDEVLTHLGTGGELLSGAARQAYAMAMVSTLPADKRLVAETIRSNGSSRLPGLIDLKILEPAGEAKNAVTVKVYGDTYKANGGWEFAKKLVEALSIGATRAAKAAHDLYHSEVKTLKAQATVSVAEMLRRKSGPFCADVPDVKDGEKFLPGGVLLAASDGKMIRVIKAIGHFQRIMTEIAEAGTSIPIESLYCERLELAKRLSDDKFRHARILHAVLRRGVAEAQKGEARNSSQLKLVV
ncbi:MAG: hypothetical protein AAB456_00800 [Patescibacteria group bacterium]